MNETETPVIEEQPPEQEPVAEAPQEEAPQEAPPVFEVTLDEEAKPQEEAHWVRNLRKQNRELQKKLRDVEARLPQQADYEPLKKPRLEELDYDTEKYENALETYYRRRDEIERVASARRAEEESQHRQWQEKLTKYQAAKSGLRVSDYEDAEAVVQNTLSVTQQGVLLAGAENPALIVYALGRNPAKAAELASITDPVKFAFALARMESTLKVNRKSPPPVMRTVSGSGPSAGAIDSTLERLRAEAERTGDISKIAAYKRQLRAKSA